MRDYTIRVHYPSDRGALVLRTSLDWDADVPGTLTEDGAVFQIQSDEPWLYFKPCLRVGDTLHWLPGFNRVAAPGAGGRDIYPRFFSGLTGTLSPVNTLDGVRFRVYFPAGYDENPLKRYPVLYMHDGANLFLPEEAFGGRAWEVDETLDLLHALAVIDQVIVVGIYPGDRMQQFTAPGYVAFSAWCADVLRPHIDAHLRTLTGPEHTAVLGSSLGGVIALQTGWAHADVFGMAGCLSSTFGWQDDLFERIGREEKRPTRIYLDSGWPEDNFERTVAMRDLLASRGCSHGEQLLHFAFPGATHDEPSWRARLHIPFQWFFGRKC